LANISLDVAGRTQTGKKKVILVTVEILYTGKVEENKNPSDITFFRTSLLFLITAFNSMK